MTRPLRTVPATRPRALGLIRVSKERDGMVSPDVQLAAIEDACTARGYDLVDVIEGLDESGSRAKSAWWPRLDQACTDVETGAYDVVIVWKWSRVARQRLRWATAVDRIESAGGRLESATENVDTTTSTGRFTRGMLAELQAFEAERIGEVWAEVHARRVDRGLPPTGKPKYGYRYNPVAKIHEPDPETGPVLADIYRRYVAGESVYALVRWLNDHGWRTTADGLWSDRSLRRVLDSGFAAGHFIYHGELHQGVHEPLISPKVWQTYLDARARRRAAPARRERSQYLLSGLVRCGRCQGTMVAGQFGNARAPKYRCKTGKEKGPDACAGGYVMASYVETAVKDWVTEIARDVDTAHEAALATKVRRTTARADATRLRRQVTATQDALLRLAVDQARTPLPARVYDDAAAELNGQLQQLEDQLEALGREARATAGAPRRAARSILARWDTAPVAHTRTELASLLRAVVVTTGRPRASFEFIPAWATT